MFFHLRVAAIALCFAGIAFLSLPPTAAIAQVDDLTPVPQDTRFRDRPFSQEAFWYIPWWDDACQYYNLPPYCSYRRLHQFENAVLTMAADSTAYARAGLDLKTPVSVAQGLEYGQILSRGQMRLNRPSETTPDRILFDETDPNLGAGSTLELFLDNNGEVTQVVYTVVTP